MKKKPLSKDVIDQWPEIFSDIDVKAVPLMYLHSLRIIFKDGKVWDLNISKYTKKTNIENLDEHISELLESYEDSIEHIDFRLDVEKVKKYITKKTNSFLKNTKNKIK